jgi:isochorismate hydrolase
MLKAEETMLVIIDIQGNLYQSMDDKLFLLENSRKLIRGVLLFDIPMIVTEQTPEKLGPTIPEINELLAGTKPISKASFSCWKNQDFVKAIKAQNRRQVLVAGIEAHVCVYQTAMDLLDGGYDVHVVADAASSRTARNREIGIGRMRDAGVAIMSTEMVLFELLQTAESDKFKDIFRIVK